MERIDGLLATNDAIDQAFRFNAAMADPQKLTAEHRAFLSTLQAPPYAPTPAQALAPDELAAAARELFASTKRPTRPTRT